MIISFKHKFIFIKVRKTAGTSMEIAFSRFCGPEDIITPISPGDEALRSRLGFRGPQNYKEGGFFNHIPAHLIRARLTPSIWDSFFKFCFERNPWDKAISLYYWRFRAGPQVPIGEAIIPPDTLMLSAFDMYTIDGKVAVDYIGKYERLDDELTYIAARLELPSSPLPLPEAKRGLRVDTRHYREILGIEERERIAGLCHREISLLGYEW